MRTLLIEDKTEIEKIIKSCKMCFVAMSENDKPYVLPMSFALEDDVVILHSAQSGRMWETLQKNSYVCMNWTLGENLAWQDERSGCSYRVKSKSVIVEGTAKFVDDYDTKEHCLHLIMAQYSDRKFKFNAPAVKNVGIIKVHIEKISAKEFGAKAVTPWNS